MKILVCSGPRMSEATIQAEFYHQCRLLGVNCHLELCTPRGRLDAAIFDYSEEKLVAVVECKRSAERYNPHSRQSQRYQSIGVPFFPLLAYQNAKRLAQRIHREIVLKKPEGISLKQLMALEYHTRSVRNRRHKKSDRYIYIDDGLIVRV